MMGEKKEEEKEEKDMLREKSNNPNLKGGEKIKGFGRFTNGNLRLERQWLQNAGNTRMSNNINNACFPNLRRIGRILNHPRQKTKPEGTSIHAYHTTSKLHHIALHHSTLHYITSHCVELHSIHLQCSDNALQHVNTPYRALAPGRPTRGSFNR